METALIGWCLRRDIGAEDRRSRIASLGAPDWDRVLALCTDHHVVPQVCMALREIGAIADPVIRARFDTREQANARRNLRLAAELTRIAAGFTTARIPFRAFKGPVLAVSAYGDLVRRQFTDLDLLINLKDYRAVKEVLLASGYRTRVDLSPAQESMHLRNDSEILFLKPPSAICLDLHWGPEPIGACAPEHTVDVLGTAVPVLPPAEALLALCEHGLEHRWNRLAYVCDFGAALCAREWDGPELLRIARKTRRRRMFLFACLLAERIMGTKPPEGIATAAARERLARTAERAAVRLLVDPPPPERPTLADIRHYYLGMQDGFGATARYALHCLGRLALPTESDIEAFRLPDPLAPLYYLVHPVRMGLKYGGSLLRG